MSNPIDFRFRQLYPNQLDNCLSDFSSSWFDRPINHDSKMLKKDIKITIHTAC